MNLKTDFVSTDFNGTLRENQLRSKINNLRGIKICEGQALSRQQKVNVKKLMQQVEAFLLNWEEVSNIPHNIGECFHLTVTMSLHMNSSRYPGTW